MPTIAATLTHLVEGQLSDREARRVTIEYLSLVFGISRSRSSFHYIKDGNLMCSVEHSAGSHSFDTEHVVRTATVLDISVLEVLNSLEKRG